MSDLVPAGDIEQIVGATRHRKAHYGKAVSAEQTVYILHSHQCRDSGIDLRDCRFSVALDRGIDLGMWAKYQDIPFVLGIWDGRLIPIGPVPDRSGP